MGHKHRTNYKSQHKLQQQEKQLHRFKRQVAVEAARLMGEEGIDNFQYARKKAANWLGIHDEHALPDNEEILEQLKIHQSLYQSSTYENMLKELRTTALKAMKLFKEFKPRLFGSVLQGHAGKHSGIDILLMADTPEEVAIHLLKHDIPYQLQDWKLFLNQHKSLLVPAYRFYAGEQQVNLIVLSENQRKVIPLSPVNWQSIERASIKQLEELILISKKI